MLELLGFWVSRCFSCLVFDFYYVLFMLGRGGV